MGWGNALDARRGPRIFAAKGRPRRIRDRPRRQRRNAAADCRRLAGNGARLARRFWPGPLTLVLPKNNLVPDVVTARGPTVAVRMPANPIALQLIAMAGVPVAAPSANRSSELSPTRAEHVWAGLHGRIDMILDGGPTTAGIESTVLDLISEPPLYCVRGRFRLGGWKRSSARFGCAEYRVFEALAVAGPLAASLRPANADRISRIAIRMDDRAALLVEQGKRIGRVLLGGASLSADMLAMPPDAASYASELYAALHALDGRPRSRAG